MFFYRGKQLIKVCLATIVSLFFFFCLWLFGKFPFPQNSIKEEYYLYSASSQGARKTELSLSDLVFLQGVSYEYQTETGEEFALEQIRRFRAVILLKEELGGSYSYYCYSPMLGKTVTLGEDKINLHIVVRGENVKMGSPLVFGGY